MKMPSHRRCRLVLIFTLAVCSAAAQRRELREVTYIYDTCGKEGNSGPSFRECHSHYTKMNSSIIRDDVFFKINGYGGAQEFRVRRSGWYNLTVAGAAGGRGLCSLSYGRGAVLKVTAYLTAGQSAAILVGQKGTGPCDVSPLHELCLKPPESVEESENCSDLWWSSDSTLIQHTLIHGGGGGGGASAVTLLQQNAIELEVLPLVMSGGGGGNGASYNHSSFSSVFNVTNVLEIIQHHLDGDTALDVTPELNNGGNGILLSCDYYNCDSAEVQKVVVRPGVGGGWNGTAPASKTDGGSFKATGARGAGGTAEGDFALGGEQCIDVVFEEVNGGFGGGGGGCGGGGGGGGYTGGSTVENTPWAYGEGGYSFVANGSSDKEVIVLDSYVNADALHGFVEIVPVDCGCTGSCVMYESDQFECVCPENTVLAPDQSDCYNRFALEFTSDSLDIENAQVHLSGLMFTKQLFIYSMRASLNFITQDDSGEVACAIALIGEKEQFVLVSNPVKEQGESRSLAVFNETGRGEIGDYEEFLHERVLVTGAVVLSNSLCVVQEISANISIQQLEQDPVSLERVKLLVLESGLLNFSSGILQLTATPGPTATSLVPAVIGGAVGALSILCVIVLIAVLLLVCLSKRTKSPVLGKNEAEATHTLDQQDPSNPVHAYEEIALDDNKEKLASTTSPGVTRYETMFSEELVNSGNNRMSNDPLNMRYEMMFYRNGGSFGNQAKFSSKFGVLTPSIDFTAYNKSRTSLPLEDWEFPREKLTFMRELGEGQFGKVLLMKTEGIAGYEQPLPVAVKTITSTDPEVVKNFRQEAELMKKFCHPNIVSLLGCSLEDSDLSTPLMIIEYMCYGDLEGFLQSNRPKSGETSPVTLMHCYSFAIDVAKALEFLSSSCYVHRDIASRNCLVDSGLRVKIADFGMARGVHSKDYYKIAGSAVLPVRWMAPESLLLGVFTTASDIWSFGVLLLEIITFADTPLEGIPSEEIVEMAQKSTLNHKQPADCPDEWFHVVQSCHMISPQDRPKPPEVLNTLQEAMKILLAVARSEQDTREPPTHSLIRSELRDAQQPESLQTVAFPVESFSQLCSFGNSPFQDFTGQLHKQQAFTFSSKKSEPGSLQTVGFPVESLTQSLSFSSPFQRITELKQWQAHSLEPESLQTVGFPVESLSQSYSLGSQFQQFPEPN